MIDLLIRRSTWFLAAAVGLALIAIPFALRLDVNTNLIHLLPPDRPAVRSFREFEDKVGGHTFLSVLVESPDPSANWRFGEALAKRLGARSWAYQVHFRRDVDFVQSRWPFLLPEKNLLELETRLREALNKAKVRRSPLSIDLDQDRGEQGWDAFRSLLRSGIEGQGSLKEFRTNADGTALLIQVQMRHPTTRVRRTEAILTEAESDISALQPPTYHPRLRARLYGGVRFRVDEYHSVIQDLQRASVITFPAMLLLPALMLGSWWEPLVVLIPVGVGMAWTHAGAQLAFGGLNLVTCFLFLILFGISDDYPIHFLFCIREEVQRGAGVREGTLRAMHDTTVPMVFSALTNVAAFLSLAWMRFRGLSQFGIIAGTGVPLILPATALTVPGIVWLFRTRLRVPKAENHSAADPPAPAAGSDRPLHWRPALVLVIMWILLAGGSAWIAHRKLEFENDSVQPSPSCARFAARQRISKGTRDPVPPSSSPRILRPLTRSRGWFKPALIGRGQARRSGACSAWLPSWMATPRQSVNASIASSR